VSVWKTNFSCSVPISHFSFGFSPAAIQATSASRDATALPGPLS